jgi:hypothetical protein
MTAYRVNGEQWRTAEAKMVDVDELAVEPKVEVDNGDTL